MGATYESGNVKSRQFCWLWRLVIYKPYVSEERAVSVFRVEDICRTYLPTFGSYLQITPYHLSQNSKLVTTAGLMAHLTAFFYLIQQVRSVLASKFPARGELFYGWQQDDTEFVVCKILERTSPLWWDLVIWEPIPYEYHIKHINSGTALFMFNFFTWALPLPVSQAVPRR
jgi:hypothetical protein